MEAKQIIVIRSSQVGALEAKMLFDRHGIVRDRDYLFFDHWGEHVLPFMTQGTSQLVFTSHIQLSHNACEVAKAAKEANPQAIVFALTTSEVANQPDFEALDGVISRTDHHVELPITVVRAFQSGSSRSQLQTLVRDALPWNPAVV